MATKQIRTYFESSKNLYLVVWNEAGQVLDFDDDAFAAIGDATTPTFALSEETDRGGGQFNGYSADLDLGLLNLSLTPQTFTLAIHERAGGSPAPTTDRMLGASEIVVQAAEEGDEPITVDLVGCNTTTQGVEVRYLATVRRAGRRLDIHALDDTATLELSAREHGAGADQFAADPVTVRSDGDFEVTVASIAPAAVFTADRNYLHTVVLTVAGETFETRVPIPVYG